MVEFAGFHMPLQYSGLIKEHLAVRENMGIFDVSHMGEIWAKGPAALDFVQKITSNDASVLYDGKVQYSCFPNGRGGIVDDLLVYKVDDQSYLMVVNAANIEKDWNWCMEQGKAFGLKPGEGLYNASPETAQLAVQGPEAMKLVQKLTSDSVEDMEFYTWKWVELAGEKDVLISTTGYTGSGGCELYMKNESGPRIWDALFEAGRDAGLVPAGLAARDTLRLEMGFCLYGNDIDASTSPIEAGLGWITKFVPGNDFIDREFLARQKEEGVTRRLRGFVMKEKGIPRQHYEICNEHGDNIGVVTSGTMSPSLRVPIGMGYINKEYMKFGAEIFVKIRNKLLKAEVVKLPFYKGA